MYIYRLDFKTGNLCVLIFLSVISRHDVVTNDLHIKFNHKYNIKKSN